MESRRVIFLDCDGVLCNARSLMWEFEEDDDTLHYHPTAKEVLPLEKRCIASLQHVVWETGASVVLSTAWRLDLERRTFLVDALQSNGIEVIGDTPNLGSAGRGAEIQAWLVCHPAVKQFVVFEDQDDHIENFRGHLPDGSWIHTSLGMGMDPLHAGINDANAAHAIDILTRDFEKLKT